MTKTLVNFREVKKYFPVKRSFLEGLLAKESRYVRAVDGVSLEIKDREIFSLVGESGSGKTTLGKLGLRVYAPTSGSVSFDGTDISKLHGGELEVFRRSAQMVYQDPVAALNPRTRVGEAIKEPLGFNKVGDKEEQRETAIKIIERVGFDKAEDFYRRFPHELSGGQRQRVVIARSLILRPRFVVADEPVAMLDVSIRAQILELLIELKKEMNLTLLVITHDLALAKYLADGIAIMYLGQIVESATRTDLFRNPLHPYTKALLSAVPIPDPERRRDRLVIQGEIPSAITPPSGCRFHPRCPFAFDRCKVDVPELVEREPGHFVSCHLYDK